MTTTCLVVMGVSGSGKSSIAELLATELDWPMQDGDEFHPGNNIEKMAAGVALTETDRIPWLRAIRDWISSCSRSGQHSVITCSALKREYRDVLRQIPTRVRFLHLSGSRELIDRRLRARTGHFMPSTLVDTQFRDLDPLEGDEDGLTVEIADGAAHILESTLVWLGLRPTPSP